MVRGHLEFMYYFRYITNVLGCIVEMWFQDSSLLAKKVNLAMLIPAWFYVGNAI